MARRVSGYNPTESEQKVLSRVEKALSECRTWHNTFCQKVERRYDAWRGLQAGPETKKTWRSQVHQPMLINVIEGMISSMAEKTPYMGVKPRALPGAALDDILEARFNARVCEVLLNTQFHEDRFPEKQETAIQQDLIAGFTVFKPSWIREESTHSYREREPEMQYDEAGGTIDIVDRYTDYEKEIVTRDGPTVEVRDVRDWMLPESAVSVQASPYVVDRTWTTYSVLERMEALGIYKNCKHVKETRPVRSDASGEREQRTRGADRTRKLIEIVEMWTDTHVYTVANRAVVLREDVNPFTHRQKPFVVTSAIPDAFQIPGVAVVEGLAQLQEMLWTLQNMRLDAVRMLGNPITVVRSSVDDPDDYKWAPNAQWIADDPNNDVKQLQIDATVAQITLQAESLLRGDIQNIMGGLPYTGGAESQTIDQQTATGISIVTNIAQAILQKRKQRYLWAYEKIGGFFLSLNQQFLDEARVIELVGPAGGRKWMEIDPMNLQGIFDVYIEVTGDSMMRQERRAESGALLTMAIQSAPVMAQFGSPLNLKAFWEKNLDSFDVEDKETYFMPPGQGGVGMQVGQNGNQAASPPGGTPPDAASLQEEMSGTPDGGMTNESLAAGATSPSSALTLSPAGMMQRSLARNGAGRSV